MESQTSQDSFNQTLLDLVKQEQIDSDMFWSLYSKAGLLIMDYFDELDNAKN